MTSPGPRLLPLRIKLPYATEEEFSDRYGANLSHSGVFIATQAAKPEGTAIAFEFVLKDGRALLRGEGVVDKSQPEGPKARSGMMLRFTSLDAQSTQVLERLIGAVVQLPPAPALGPPDDAVLGIDLGASCCRVAIVEDGKARLLPLGPGGSLEVPSEVALDEQGRFQCGARARARLLVDPLNTVQALKRLIGQGAGPLKLQERAVAAPELLGILLGELKGAAQRHLGREISRAVVSVPSCFTHQARTSVLEAGRSAGLQVLRLVSGPVAVALAFGQGKGLARKRILVFMLGASGLEVSVVQITGEDLEVVSAGADPSLGGLDFDERLTRWLSDRLMDGMGARLGETPLARQRLRAAAEEAKLALSTADRHPVRIPYATSRDDGSPVDLDVEVTRAILEELTAELVERTVEVTRGVLQAGGLTAQALDEVLISGGQAQMPRVRQRVEEELLRPAQAERVPDGAVAVGAALLGRALTLRAQGKPGASVSEVLCLPLGIATRDGGVRKVLDRNTRLPAEKTIAVPATPGQPVGLALFQGSGGRTGDNQYLGALELTADRPGELTVHFGLTADGCLSLSAAGPSGKSAPFLFAGGGLEPAALEALIAIAPPGEAPPPVQRGFWGGLKATLARLWATM